MVLAIILSPILGGDNITIDGNKISATDTNTTYSVSENISTTPGEVKTWDIYESGNTNNPIAHIVDTDTNTTYSGSRTDGEANTNEVSVYTITGSDNSTFTIKDTDTTYSAGNGIAIDPNNGNKISAKIGTGLKFGGNDNDIIMVDTTTTNLAYKAGSDTSSKSVSLSTGLTFAGDSNILVSTDANTAGLVNYQLAPNISVTSVTAGNTVLNASGLTIGSDTATNTSLTASALKIGGKTYVSTSGLDANSQKITNVANGTSTYDAVNYGQLQSAISSGSSTNDIDYIRTVAATGGNGGTIDLIRANGTEDQAATAVNGGLTFTSGGGVGGNNHDVEITIAGAGSGSLTLAAGSKVMGNVAISTDDSEETVPAENLTNLSINGKVYTVKQYSAGENITFGADGSINAKDTTYRVVQNDGTTSGVVKTWDIYESGNNTAIAQIVDTDTDTTYSAGAGLNMSSANEFSVKAGAAVTVDTTNGVSVNVGDGMQIASNAVTAKLGYGLGLDSAKAITVVAEQNKGISVGQNGVGVIANTNKGITVDGSGITAKIGNGLTFDNDGNIAVNAATTSLNYRANGSTTSQSVSLAQGLDFYGDENITASVDANGKVKYDLNEEISLTKVTTGNTVMTTDGISIAGKDATTGEALPVVSLTSAGLAIGNTVSLSANGLSFGGKTYVSADGLNANGQKITGVLAGTDATDAVNVSQLDAAKAAGNTKVEAGDNISVVGTPNSDESKTYTVSLEKDVTLTEGSLTVTGAAGEVLIQNGAITGPGTDPAYALNANGSASFANGNFSIASNGNITSNFGNGGQMVANGDGFGVTQSGSVFVVQESGVAAAKGDSKLAVTAGGVGITSGDSALVVGESGTVIKGGLDMMNEKITGVADGAVEEGSKDAVNGGQLKAVKDELKGDINNINTEIENINTQIGDINTSIGAIEVDIDNLDNRVAVLEETAGKHATVSEGANIKVSTSENGNGGTDYKVSLDSNITLDSVTTGNTVMNGNGISFKDSDTKLTSGGLNVGTTVVNGDGISVGGEGGSKLTNDSLEVGGKTYIDEKGINANGQKVTGVADGDISENSTDAVNGSQLYATEQHITNVENQIADNSSRINKLGRRVDKVGAGSAALAALHPLDFDPDDKLTFSAGVGNYHGQNAAAIGAFYRPTEKVMLSIGGTVGNDENMVNAGISFALDKTNNVSNSRTAMAREIVDLRAQVANLTALVNKLISDKTGADPTSLFPDVPANHWAYEYINGLAMQGIIEGYPDGSFQGDATMTRYEFASMLFKAMEKGAVLSDRLREEFKNELGHIRVDRIKGDDNDAGKIERVRVYEGADRDDYGSKLQAQG